jgi:hypothetical protein
MERYYYHGIENYYGSVGRALKTMDRILDEGILTRNIARGLFKDEDIAHVCLYRKNEEYDYTRLFATVKSARGGWIDSCFVIIINPDIEARQATKRGTDLVDEWRCYSTITPDHFAGIALPWDSINEALEEKNYDPEDRKLVSKYFKKVWDKARDRGLPIYNSESKNFPDIVDEELKSKQKSL